MKNNVFFPQALVDQWGVDGKIDLTASELIVLAEGRAYRITESVYVLAEVTGAADARDIVGRVKPKAALQEIGAELYEGSMIIGDTAYDVGPGWTGSATTPFADHLLSPERMTARGGKTDVGTGPLDDEALLKRFLEGTL